MLRKNFVRLIIGFSAGQIQLIDPLQKEYQMSRLFNEDRSIDKSSVTCLRWVPGQPQLFIASHASGNMYVYNEEYACNPNPPAYQLHKQGENYSVHVLKSKQAKNPVQRWIIGEGAINQFEFSGPDAKFMATCGQVILHL
jgi:WD repeat-containing protein 20